VSTVTGSPRLDHRWDLSPVFASDEAAVAELDMLAADADAFAQALPPLSEPARPALAGLLEALGGLRNRVKRLSTYAELRSAEDAADPAAQDLGTLVAQRMPGIQDALRGFQLAWLDLPDDRASELAELPEVAGDRHYLIASRRFAAHTLSAAEERALSARGGAAEQSWIRLWSEQSSALTITCDLGNGPAPQTSSEVMFASWDRRPEVRRTAHTALREMSDGFAPTSSHCLDAVVGDRLAVDAVRGYDRATRSTDLANELRSEMVDTMLEAVAARTGIWRSWNRIKAGLLGFDRLPIADRVAPLGAMAEMTYPEVVEQVVASFTALSDEAGRTVAGFFLDGRVDAAPRAGKMGGAFCAELDGTCGPYLLLNHSGRQMDAQVMAHEVGHGLHLARCLAAQSPLVGLPSFALIEIPSTFAELWLVEGLLEHETDPGRRLALQAGAVETAIGNVFETAVHAQAERGCYRLKAEGLTLSVERLNELWGEQFRAGFGESVEGEEVVSRWALMPHAIVYRFYLYNYSFSCLIALALMRRLRDDPQRFAARYLDYLDRGGNGTPAEVLAPLGIDLHDPGLWDEGLDEMERMVEGVAAA
jgi:oligoendopeptidase F